MCVGNNNIYFRYIIQLHFYLDRLCRCTRVNDNCSDQDIKLNIVVVRFNATRKTIFIGYSIIIIHTLILIIM